MEAFVKLRAPKLTTLILNKNHISLIGIRALALCPWITNLKILSLSDTGVTNASIAALIKINFTNLEKLDLCKTFINIAIN
jgi:hypothetical protein